MKSRDKLKLFYVHYNRGYDKPAWQVGDLR